MSGTSKAQRAAASSSVLRYCASASTASKARAVVTASHFETASPSPALAGFVVVLCATNQRRSVSQAFARSRAARLAAAAAAAAASGASAEGRAALALASGAVAAASGGGLLRLRH